MRSLNKWMIVIPLVTFAFAFTPKAGPNAEHEFDLDNLDHTASTCVDFYQFSNGGWLAHKVTKTLVKLSVFPSAGVFACRRICSDVLRHDLDEL